jgi:uncharacterized repeat protein (TIGR01451 family)
MNKTMKTLLLGLGIFGAIAAAVFIFYSMRTPATPKLPSPTPKPIIASTPTPSPETPSIDVVDSTAACDVKFSVTEELVPGLNCVSKDLYKDVDSNDAGTYTLTGNKLADSFTLVPGDTYVYSISYKNTGTGAIDGKITDVLPTGLTYVDSSDGCTFTQSSRTITCTIPSVAASGTGHMEVRFSVDKDTSVASIKNTATVTPTTGDASTCSVTNPVFHSAAPSGSPSSSPSPSPVAQLDCVSKRVYQDNSSNSAGKYFLNTQVTDTTTLTDGYVVVFNILIKNAGGAAVPDTKITDVLSSNLTFMDAESGCTYASDNRTLTCDVGNLAANTETSRSFRARIGVGGATAVANTADVFSSNGQRDSCSVTINAQGKIVETVPSPVPSALPQAGVFEVTAGTLGVGVLLLIAGAVGLLLL